MHDTISDSERRGGGVEHVAVGTFAAAHVHASAVQALGPGQVRASTRVQHLHRLAIRSKLEADRN